MHKSCNLRYNFLATLPIKMRKPCTLLWLYVVCVHGLLILAPSPLVQRRSKKFFSRVHNIQRIFIMTRSQNHTNWRYLLPHRICENLTNHSGRGWGVRPLNLPGQLRPYLHVLFQTENWRSCLTITNAAFSRLCTTLLSVNVCNSHTEWLLYVCSTSTEVSRTKTRVYDLSVCIKSRQLWQWRLPRRL